ncbi:MAG: bifunctional helix-turn-helix domain-containing protein/methylated-DNA--[protein]-cysteine S-methyltransferase, partial [Nitrospirales bacterium]|nr:bifunctional helix-turn-helix domain-containing protein/methylated-DNA--[protein]-cysteine S-methyltransferase [Nitrospirales bacterium]
MSLNKIERQANDYRRIEQAIRNLTQRARRQPDLKQLAANLNLSESHFQRLFSRWAGVSPKRFLQFLTLDYAKCVLAKSDNLMDVTLESGLSSVSRLHDLFIECEAVTPGEYRSRGKGVSIMYGFHPSPFGECLLAATSRGICGLTFIQKGNGSQALKALSRRWGQATLAANSSVTRPLLERIFPTSRNYRKPVYLFVKGTNFQIKVWEALLRIPTGSMVSYSNIARQVGMPQASRSVANAIADNPIQYLIPCHRVIQKVGAFGGYQGGPERKKALNGWEAALGEIDVFSVPLPQRGGARGR